MTLDQSQLLALAQGAGGGGDPQTAVAIALAESGGDPGAQGKNQDGSRDRGLWQINDRAHPDVDDACAFDPTCNARAAYVISSGWTDFTPWTTFQSGAYLRFMAQVGTVPQQPQGRSLYGQDVVGTLLQSPWFEGQWEVTQGWGPTQYDGEPEGHGYAHWHAGVDVGLACGTTLRLPGTLSGVARSLDNPGGYGTALVILVDGGPAVLLGHLRQRLVDDGTPVQGGAELALSNNTGNSTGCHLHFEVRPRDAKQPLGMARYGTDLDPSSWLLTANGNPSTELLAAQSSGNPIGDAIGAAMQSLVAGGEVLLGAALVLTGLIATAYGLRGQGPQELTRDAQTTAARLSRPKRRERPRGPQRTSGAAETRIRPDLQGPNIVEEGSGRIGRRPRVMSAMEARVAAGRSSRTPDEVREIARRSRRA